MSVEPRDLRVAELIKQEKSYTDIQAVMREQGTPISNQKISEIKKMIEAGIIGFREDGTAYEAEPKFFKDIHEQVMGVITKEASKNAVFEAEGDYKLGYEIRQFWFLKAQEKGMTLRDFVKAALMFYDDYRDMAAENEELRKISRVALQQLNVDTIRKKKLELYYRFCRDTLNLRAKGFAVPEQVIVDFYADLDYLSKGGEYPIEEVLRGVSKSEAQDIDHPSVP